MTTAITSSSSTSSVAQALTQTVIRASLLCWVWRLSGIGRLGHEAVNRPVVRSSSWRKLAFDEVRLVPQLVQQGRDDLLQRCPHRRGGGRNVFLNRLVQVGKPVVGHRSEHVMFEVVVHVPVEEAVDSSHKYR